MTDTAVLLSGTIMTMMMRTRDICGPMGAGIGSLPVTPEINGEIGAMSVESDLVGIEEFACAVPPLHTLQILLAVYRRLCTLLMSPYTSYDSTDSQAN